MDRRPAVERYTHINDKCPAGTRGRVGTRPYRRVSERHVLAARRETGGRAGERLTRRHRPARSPDPVDQTECGHDARTLHTPLAGSSGRSARSPGRVRSRRRSIAARDGTLPHGQPPASSPCAGGTGESDGTPNVRSATVVAVRHRAAASLVVVIHAAIRQRRRAGPLRTPRPEGTARRLPVARPPRRAVSSPYGQRQRRVRSRSARGGHTVPPHHTAYGRTPQCQ